MRYLFLIFLFFLSLEANEKILIFSCSSGSGHLTTAQTLTEQLQDKYTVVTVCPHDEMYPEGTKAYCHDLAHGNYFMLNLGHILWRIKKPFSFLFEDEKYNTLILKYIEKERPDILISCVPFSNQLYVDAANKYRLPLLIVTTDNDLTYWVFGLSKRNLKNVQITISRNLHLTRDLLISNKFLERQIKTIGLAVRPQFFELKDKQKICSSLQLPLNKDKILIMFGGAGSTQIYEYITRINEKLSNVHFIACTGKSGEGSHELKLMPLKNNNSITILSYTPHISDYMAVSDLLITKPGTMSIEEGFVLQLPILIDGTKGYCLWEKPNADLVVNYKVGLFVEDLDEVTNSVSQLLKNKNQINETYKKLPKNNFNKFIHEIVDHL